MSIRIRCIKGREYIVAMWTDEYGKQHEKGGFKSKRDAKQWADAKRIEVKARKLALKHGDGMTVPEAYRRLTGVPIDAAERILTASEASGMVDSSVGNVKRWIDEFIQISNEGRDGLLPVRESTVRTYRVRLAHLSAMYGHRDPRTIVRRDMQSLRDKLIERGMARSTVKGVIRCIHTLFNWLIYKHIYRRDNPCKQVKVALETGRKDQIVPLHMEEIHSTAAVARIIEVLDSRVHSGRDWLHGRDAKWIDLRARAFVLLSLTAGLRNGEARALMWKDINLETHVLQVARSADNKSNRIGSVKTSNGVRAIAIPRRTVEALREWKKHDGYSDFVFHDSRGRIAGYGATKSMWSSVQKEAGVPRKKLHSMRHFYASKLIDADYHEETISRMLGHASVEFTRRVYIHLLERRKRQMVDSEKIDAVFD